MASKYAQVKAKDYTWFKTFFQLFMCWTLFYPFYFLFYKIKVYGRENIPKDRSFIVAANHMSHLDPTIVSASIKRPVAFMAKEELFHVPFLSQLIQLLGAFSVNREKFEIATIRSAKEVIATKRWIMSMYPQGTRIEPGKIGKINQGFAFIAKAAKCEILPVSITGSHKYNFIPFKGNVVVKIGKPIPIPTDVEETMDLWGRTIAEMTGFEYDREESIPKEPVKQ